MTFGSMKSNEKILDDDFLFICWCLRIIAQELKILVKLFTHPHSNDRAEAHDKELGDILFLHLNISS